jgi:hypothetical protein
MAPTPERAMLFRKRITAQRKRNRFGVEGFFLI